MKKEHRPTAHDVLWAYRMLLGREPESRAATDQSAQMSSISHLRTSIFRSTEFQKTFAGHSEVSGEQKYRYVDVDDLRADMVWHSVLSVNEVNLAYKVLLKRDVESRDVALRHTRDTPNLFGLVSFILNSPEYLDGIESRVLLSRFERRLNPHGHTDLKSKILLFGAYGNGNLGDMCQANALTQLLSSIVWSSVLPSIHDCSWARSVPIIRNKEFSPDHIVTQTTTHDEILDPQALRTYQLLLIGGGGLLATPHFPFHMPQWTHGLRQLRIPYALIGVGASNEELNSPTRKDAYRCFIENASFVSGRDVESIKALSQFATNVHFLPDPYFMLNYRARQYNPISPSRVILVGKAPINEAEMFALKILLEIQKHCVSNDIACEVVFFEEILDAPVASQFINTSFIRCVSDFLAKLSASTVVYSMRYHGIIFSLCNGNSCWSVGAKKNEELYVHMSLEHRVIKTEQAHDGVLKGFTESDWLKVNTYYESGQAGLNACKQFIRAEYEVV